MRCFKPLVRALSISACMGVAACGGRAAVLPEEGRTMLEIYDAHFGSGGDAALAAARFGLRRPLEETELDPTSYTRTAANEVNALFVRLPNPDLVLYVFPHLATDEDVPIPGYSTVLPFYERVHYALPGEAE